MKLLRPLVIALLAVFLMGATECQHTDTVILPEGPKASVLSTTKDTQIADLAKQAESLRVARAGEQAEASKAASNLKGVLKAAEYMPDGLPTDAAKAEATLGLTRLPPDDPAETVKALERVVLIVTGQRDEALKRYAEADAATKAARALIVARDAELIKLDNVIKAREVEIAGLKTAAETERTEHAADVTKALTAKDKALADYKTEQASKERGWWINATRIAGLGLVVIGAIVLGVFKLPGAGGGLLGAGLLVGLISMGIESLTSQPWWPYLCGGVFLVVVGLSGYLIYRLWVKHQLGDKKTQAIQDMIDEATAKGDLAAVEELKAHLTYRMGDKTSFFGKRQADEVAALGLVNPKGEADLKTATVSTTGA